MKMYIDGYQCEIEPIPVSQTCRLHITERPTELGGADFKGVEGKCGHFSIRGYVAEIRERDWKMSWPFLMHDEHTKLYEQAHQLPPMSVSEFRWWRCPNCLRKAGADTDGGVLHCFCHVQDDVQKLPLGFLQVSTDDNLFDERKRNEDATANLNSGECHPSLCTDAKENEISVLCPSNGGLSNFIVQSCEPVSHSPHEEPHILDSSSNLRKSKDVHNLLLSRKPIFYDNSTSEAGTFRPEGNEPLHSRGSTRGEVHSGTLYTEFCTSVSNNDSKFCQMDNVGVRGSHLANVKERHDKVTADHGMSQDVDMGGRNDGPLDNITGPVNELDSMELYESDHDIFESNDELARSDAYNQHIAGLLGTSNGSPHWKKPRKMRLLTDIIRSEVSDASRKILIFNKDAEIKSIHPAVDHSKEGCDTSKDLGPHSHLKNSPIVCKDEKKNIMYRKCGKTLRTEDKGSSLMSWLKDVAGKVKIPKRYGQNKHRNHIMPEAVNSKSSADVSTGIGLPPCQSDLGTRGSGKKVNLCKKQNKMTQFEDVQSFLTYCQEPISEKSDKNAGKTKHITTKIVRSKSSKDALPGLGARQGPNDRRALLSKKKKFPQVEDGTSTPANWPKDSLTKSICDSSGKPQVHKKASKKLVQKTGEICEQDGVDDIPMEIVELMAKNQHDRCVLNAQDTAKNMYKVPEKIVNMNVTYIEDFTEVSGKDASGFLHEKNCSVQRPQSINAGSGVCTSGKKVVKASEKPNESDCMSGEENNSLLVMNQLDRSYTSMGLMPFSECQESLLSGIDLPGTVSGINPDRWSLTNMQFPEAYNQYRSVPPWSSYGQPYDALQIPSRSLPFDLNIPHEVDNLHHKGVGFHRPNPSSGRNESANNHGICSRISMKPDFTCSLQKQKGKVLSETRNESLLAHAYSSMDQRNKCLSMMGPLDLYTNEAISAMNLLKLMDQGACSNRPVDNSMERKQANALQNPEILHNHQCKEFFRQEDGVCRTGDLSICPRPFEFFDQNQCLGSSLDPMQKIDELCCSSHKVASDSSKSRSHLGFTNGLSNDATSPKSRGRGKRECSYSSIRTGGKSSWGSVARDENRVNAKKRIMSASCSLAYSINNGMTQSMTVCSVTEMCGINRNPAEFTIPGAGNEYMIGSEDLKCVDTFTSIDKLHAATHVDGHKRRKMMKLTAIRGN